MKQKQLEQVTKPGEPKFNSLVARYLHPEHTGILVDRLGHGDISHWATGTTQARRPEVGKVERVSNPIRRLASVHPVENVARFEGKPDVILIGNHVTDNGSVIMAKRSERIVPITNRFSTHYERSIERSGHDMVDDRSYLSAISEESRRQLVESLRGREIPRE